MATTNNTPVSNIHENQLTGIHPTGYQEARGREPMGYATVPPSLRAGPNSYALKAAGDCMSPELCELDVILCDPDQEPGPGDLVAIWWKGGEQLPSVKRLVTALPPHSLRQYEAALLVVEQLNPRKQLTAPLHLIAAVHKVIGKAGEAQL